jgi:S-DNA-T family DNA segregation ATPase FtsK/SpoIIIE
VAGEALIGVEVPNAVRRWVSRDDAKVLPGTPPLTVPLGVATDGTDLRIDLADPAVVHLLVAGATGSGKSSFLRTLLTTLVARTTPAELGLLLIDPKRVEFTPFRRCPQLLGPVVTSPGDAVEALECLVAEMEQRYELLELVELQDIETFNRLSITPLPYRVVVVDELADLMLSHRKEIEPPLVRIAQKGRAAGLHLVLGTQRPTVDVVTGLLAANLPARIAFQVTSSLNSRLVLESSGAQALLGSGDGLYKPAGPGAPVRFQGVHTTSAEVAEATTPPPVWPSTEPPLWPTTQEN